MDTLTLSFDITGMTLFLMLETGTLTWEQYSEMVPPDQRPNEYKDLASFTKNKGKVSKRWEKESEWAAQAAATREDDA
jgi:hypothetical protein